jgi:hypothetical protein
MAETEPRPRRLSLANILVLLGVVVLGAMLARRLDFARLLAALQQADWRLVALAALINVTLNTVARVRRWAALLDALPRAGPGPRFGELTALYFASQAASNLLPARAGEALRVVHLHRRHGYSIAGLMTVQLVEILFGAVSLGTLALVVTPVSGTPASLRAALVTFAALGPGGSLALLWLAGRAPTPPPPTAALPPTGAEAPTAVVQPGPPVRGVARVVGLVRGLLIRLIEAVRYLRSPRVVARSLAWALLSDLTDVLMIGLVLWAVGVSLSPVNWVVAFVAINLVLLLPTTPAQIGVLEMGAVAALRALGVDDAPALAFALLYHASHVIPPTIVGGILMLRLDLRRRIEDDSAAERVEPGRP